MDSAKKHKCGTIVERHLEVEQYQLGLHEQGCTHSDMEEFDSIAMERKNYVAVPEEKSSLQLPIQRRTSQSRRKQQHWKDQITR